MSEPHPVKDFLAAHERCFRAKYGVNPAPYTKRDAKHALVLLTAYGVEHAHKLLGLFFSSRDPWIQASGHGLGFLASSTVQNKLITQAVRPVRRWDEAPRKVCGS